MKNVLYLFLILTSTIHSNSQSVDQFVSRYLFMEKKDWGNKKSVTGDWVNFQKELKNYQQDEVYNSILPYFKSNDERALLTSIEFIIHSSKNFSDSLKTEVIDRVSEVMLTKFDIYGYRYSSKIINFIPAQLQQHFEPRLFSPYACENLLAILKAENNYFSLYPLAKMFGTLKLDGTKEEILNQRNGKCRGSISTQMDDCYSLNFSLAMMGDQEGVDYIISYIDRINGWDSRINYKDLGLIKNRKLFQRIIDNIVAGTVKDGHRVEKSVADPIREIKDNIIDFPQIGKYGALFDADIVKAVEWLTVHQYDFEIKP